MTGTSDSPHSVIGQSSIADLIAQSIEVDTDGCHLWRGRLEAGHPYVLRNGHYINVRGFVTDGLRVESARCGKSLCVRRDCLLPDIADTPSAPPGMNLALYVELHLRTKLERFIARRVRRGSDYVNDVISELYLRFCKRTTASIQNPESYAYTCASHLIYEFSLKEAQEVALIKKGIYGIYTRDGELLDVHHSTLPSYEGVENDLEQENVLALVLNVLADIKPKQQQIFYGWAVLGMTYGELAWATEVSESMVKKYIAITFAHIRNRLDLKPATRRELFIQGKARRRAPSVAQASA